MIIWMRMKTEYAVIVSKNLMVGIYFVQKNVAMILKGTCKNVYERMLLVAYSR